MEILFAWLAKVFGEIAKPLFAEIFKQLNLAGSRKVEAVDAARDDTFERAWRDSITGQLRE